MSRFIYGQRLGAGGVLEAGLSVLQKPFTPGDAGAKEVRDVLDSPVHAE